ncbi:diaminopimelate epimerase [Acetitomaculum ruminis]|nr:diaminopimelate epimerase [Acetitomaculum ruminis]
MNKTITLKKYHGLGNDYLVLDPNKNEVKLLERNIQLLCQRNFGVGADGILYGPLKTEDGKFGLKIFNPDGYEAEKSGNGIRIFAKYLLDENYINEKSVTISTIAGDIDVEFLDETGEKMKVDMGTVNFSTADIPVNIDKDEVINEPLTFNGNLYNCTCLSLGNPHCVIMLEDVSGALAKELGPYVENSEYFPKRVNMLLLKVIDKKTLQIEIYERGAGYTLASGSSACAAAAAAHRLGLIDNEVTVEMPGGDLLIEISKDKKIFMTGSVTYVANFTLAENFFA